MDKRPRERALRVEGGPWRTAAAWDQKGVRGLAAGRRTHSSTIVILSQKHARKLSKIGKFNAS